MSSSEPLAVSPHTSLARAVSCAHPVPGAASALWRPRDLFLIPKEKSELC